MKRSIALSRIFKSESLHIPALATDFLFMILFFIIFIPASFNHDFTAVSLYLIIPFLFVYSLYHSISLFTRFRIYRLFIFLFCWMLFSGIVAADKDLFWAEIKEMLVVIMFTFILIRFCWKNYRYIYFFYLLYIIKFLYIFYYAYQNGLFAVNLSSERFNLDELNANVFGYFGFFALIAAFLLAAYTRKFQKSFYTFIFYLIFVLVITAGVLAASRGTLVISIIAFVLLLMIKYLYPISIRSVLPIILLAISIFIVSKYLDSTFQNSLIKSRFDAKEDSRYDLLVRAFDIGKENIALGVGSGNFVLYNPEHQFSHNSFAELWATNGLVALILFVLLLLEALRNIIQYIKVGGDRKIGYYFLVIWGTFSIYNFFYVFYINFFMIAFIFLIVIHVKHLKVIRLKNRIKKPQTASLSL